MTYLLDTGVWLRAVSAAHTVPASVLGALRRSDQTFGLSAISLWEVGKKVQLGKLSLPKDLSGWFADALATNLTVLPIDTRVVVEVARLAEFPTRDPADEIIVATARVHGLTLFTTDRMLRGYRHARVRYFRPRLSRKPPSLE